MFKTVYYSSIKLTILTSVGECRPVSLSASALSCGKPFPVTLRLKYPEEGLTNPARLFAATLLDPLLGARRPDTSLGTLNTASSDF